MRRISWRSPVVLILGFELIIALWVVVRVATVYLDLHSAQTSAMTVESALRDQHAESVGDQVSHLQKRAHAAASGSSGPTWKLFEHVPFIGDDARTIADLSVVVNDLAQNVVPPAVEAGRMVQAHGILDQQGALNLPVIERVTPDLRRARAGVD
ncbi:MAG: hypothetical protein JWP74_771, partial [Marmoricola sp.]|nr:hypothetical protein [Marmoricola sp.]